MKKSSYKFERIPQLRLFDLKAQKKSINYKKFRDMPLTFEETIAESIAHERSITQSSTNENFVIRPRKNVKSSTPLLRRLAVTKTLESAPQPSEECHALKGIISKCDRLKYRLLTGKKLNRFQKDTSKCYNYLFELSNFNFQKYEDRY